MKTVALIGYYGFNNAGDEAILYSIVRSLRHRDRKTRIFVLSADPAKTERLYRVEARNRWRLGDLIKTIWQSDVLVFGGGSLLQDVTSTRSLDYYLWVARIGLRLGRKVYFMAQGIGPLKQEASRRKTVRLLNRVDVVTVRDRDSKQELLDMGVLAPRIEVTADSVLSLYRNEVERAHGRKVLARYGIEGEEQGRLIGLSVRDWKDLHKYKTVIARVCDELVRKGFRVVFIPFHFPDDVSCAREIAKEMQEEAVVIREELGTVEMLGVVGDMDLVIGMRMHSVIMASLMGVAAVGLAYDPKIDAAVEATAQTSGGRVENLNPDTLLSLSLQKLFEGEADRHARRERADRLMARSRKNIDLLMDLLEDRDA